MRFKLDFSEIEKFANRLTDDTTFHEFLQAIVEEMARNFHEILVKNTPEKTGKLKAGWGDASEIPYKIKRVNGGFTVEVGNDVEYAYYVNYGHHSYNQHGGPWIVNDAHRTVMYKQGGSGATFVYGHFFVEDSMLEFTEGSGNINRIIEKELNEWFRWCTNG